MNRCGQKEKRAACAAPFSEISVSQKAIEMRPQRSKLDVAGVVEDPNKLGMLVLVGSVLFGARGLALSHIGDAIAELGDQTEAVGRDLGQGLGLALCTCLARLVGDGIDAIHDGHRETDIEHVGASLFGVFAHVMTPSGHEDMRRGESKLDGHGDHRFQMKLIRLITVHLVPVGEHAPLGIPRKLMEGSHDGVPFC